MTIFHDIDSALDGHLTDMPNLPPVAWENDEYTPALGTLYLRPTVLPGGTVQASLGDSGQDQQVGVYQVDVFAETNTGKFAALQMADLVADWFKRGTVLTYNDRKVRIRTTNRRAGQPTTEGWYMVIVEIYYIIYTQARV